MKEEKRKLLARVAYMYYEQELTQAEIAKKLSLYRTTVSRMLAQAKSEGIVEVKIHSFDGELFHLEEALKRLFPLTAVEVVATTVDMPEEEKEERLARNASAWLKRHVKDGDVIGVSWGESVGQTIHHVENKPLNNTIIVPIVGGPSHVNSRYHVNTLVYELGRKLNSRSLFVNATVIQEDKRLAKGIFDSRYFHELREYWQRLTLAIVGIGGPLQTPKSQWRDLLTPADYQELVLREAIGDCCCRFYDGDGKILKGDLEQRTIGLSLQELAQVPYSVGIARGKNKARSLFPLLEKGYINTLMTDQETARILVELKQ